MLSCVVAEDAGDELVEGLVGGRLLSDGNPGEDAGEETGNGSMTDFPPSSSESGST